MVSSVFDGWEDHDYCYVTTVGRVSGRPHTIEIWFVVADGSAWLLTEPEGRTDWVLNLRREPQVILRIGDIEVEARAEVVDLPADAKVRSDLADRYRHADDGLEAWAAEALTVRVTPSG